MPITQAEGETFIKEFIRIQDVLIGSDVLNDVNDENTKRFYSSQFISFVFTKARIDALFENNNDADALRLYYAANPDGEPTIVLVPCQLSQANTPSVNKLAPTSGDPVDQHPNFKGGRSGLNSASFSLGNNPI